MITSSLVQPHRSDPKLTPVVMLVAKGFQRPDLPRARQEAKSLSDAGYRVFVLAWDRYGEFRELENVEGTTVHSFSTPRLPRFSKFGLALGGMLFQITIVFQALRLINGLKQRPIIHAHDINTLLPGYFLRVIGLGCALVYDCREFTYWIYSEWFHPLVGASLRGIEQACLRHVDAVITVTEPIADYLRRFNQRVELIYNCPVTSEIPKLTKREARIQLGLPANAFIVSFVGAIRYGCRLELLLTLAAETQMDNVHFLVVGDGPLGPAFREAARGIPKTRFSVIPMVPHPTALSYVLSSDLTWIVHQNRAESVSERLALPWKLFESLACGVPVIVEANTFQAKLVSEHKCGIVLENDDPTYVSESIMSLARDQTHHGQMSEAARGVSSSLGFTWEAMSRRLMIVYARLPQLRP